MDAFNVSFNVPTIGHAEAVQVLREMGITNVSAVEPTIRTVSKGIPMKKFMVVVDMSLTTGKALDPARFASTLYETGLLT